jgi:hypothetical protein
VGLAVLGIDVGKFEFHCALNVKGRVHTNHFPYSEAGSERLRRWLANRRVSRVTRALNQPVVGARSWRRICAHMVTS